jgi:hypothetical protein
VHRDAETAAPMNESDPDFQPGPHTAGWIDFGRWRAQRLSHLATLLNWLRESGIDDALWRDSLTGLDQRLRRDVVQLAFVAEFSRGKSELINAIFFASHGRRVLPAAAGRTTMCPLEITASTPRQAPTLRLLPIDTRLDPATLAQWKLRSDGWTELRCADAASLQAALAHLADTVRVAPGHARSLGFVIDDDAPRAADGDVDVPRWRHALLDIEHELLAQGLSVLDTPGLNALGAEPELTLSLLPGAQAVLFLLGADTGVTRSDLQLWNEHIGEAGRARALVVLNKIDTLWDDLRSPDDVAAQIERQRESVAATLQVPLSRVFALSAHKALLARIRGDDALLRRSGLPALELALARIADVERRELIDGGWRATLLDALQRVERQLQQRVEQASAQLDELAALHGRNLGLVQGLRRRVGAERAEFDGAVARAQALYAINARQLAQAVAELDPARLLEPLRQTRERLRLALLKTGLREALAATCADIAGAIATVERELDESREMLGAAFELLNTEFAFGLPVPKPLRLEGTRLELTELQRSYLAYLTPARWLQLQRGQHAERLLDAALERLRTVLERARRDLQAWNRSALASLESQLRERRRGLARRAQNLEQLGGTDEELRSRIAAQQQAIAAAKQLRERARRYFEGVLH